MTERELEKECKERNRQMGIYIQQHYGSSSGPRRKSHFEVRNGQLCSVEE